MKKIVLVIIFIVIGGYSVQAQNNTDTTIGGTEAEKVLVNGEYLSKEYGGIGSSFQAIIIYKKKLYNCFVEIAIRYLNPTCSTVPN